MNKLDLHIVRMEGDKEIVRAINEDREEIEQLKKEVKRIVEWINDKEKVINYDRSFEAWKREELKKVDKEVTEVLEWEKQYQKQLKAKESEERRI